MINRTRAKETKRKNTEKDTNSFSNLPLADNIPHENPNPILTSKERKESNRKLLIAVEANSITEAELEAYLEQGADINFQYSSEFTPLMCAAWMGYTDICKLLIKYGADINVRVQFDGSTALLYATYKERLETVNYLLSVGANPLLKDYKEKTAYDRSENKEIKQALKKYIGLWGRAGKKSMQKIFRAVNAVNECNPDRVYKIFVSL